MKPLPVRHTAEIQNTSDSFDRSAFASYQTAKVIRCDANAELDHLTIGGFGDLDCVGISNERLDDFFDRFFHESIGSIETVESVASVEFVESVRSKPTTDSMDFDRLERLDRLAL